MNNIGTGLSTSNWFSLTTAYQGVGRVEFSKPLGYIQGHGTATYDSNGRLVLELVVENVEAEELKDRSDLLQLQYLLTGNKPVTQPNGERVYGIGVGTQRYANVALTTPSGILTAPDALYFGETLTIGTSDGGYIVRFLLNMANYEVRTAQAPKYWVLPLSNFLAEFRTRSPELSYHPLRILPLPNFPDDMSEGRGSEVQLAVVNDYRLIAFDFAGAPAFIEPLLDYRERRQLLEAGDAQNLVTAVMVGENGPHDANDLDTWFPVGFMRLLGFATGNEVGAQWFELRDEKGVLVRRIHKNLGRPQFTRGTPVILEEYSRDPNTEGLGYLLTKAANLPDLCVATSRLSVVVKQLIRCGLSNRTIEERFTTLFAILDGLCTEAGIDVKSLWSELDSAQQTQIQSLRDAAASHVRKLANTARAAGNHIQFDALTRIEGRISNIANQDEKFGRAVVALVDQFGLPDATILDEYYVTQSRPLGLETWSQAISYYRAILIHAGYLDSNQSGHDIDEAIGLLRHLYDVVVRIVLMRLGYDGTYQPMTKNGSAALPVDWVQTTTPVSELGYK